MGSLMQGKIYIPLVVFNFLSLDFLDLNFLVVKPWIYILEEVL